MSSRRAKPDANLARWCEVLASCPVSDVVPEGWLTAYDLAKQQKLSVTEIRRRVRAAVENGSIDAQKFRVWTGNKTHAVTHYRIK